MSNTNTIESPCEEVLSITKNDLENFLMTRYWFVHRNQARRLCNFFDIDYSWLQTQWKKQGLTERGFRDTGKFDKMSNKKPYIKIERTYHYNTNPSRGLHAYVDSTVIIDGEKDYRDPDNLFPMVSIMPVEEYVKRANEYDKILLAYQKDDDVLLVVRYMTSLAELADEFHTVDVYECKFCRKSRDSWILREDYIFCNEECYKEWILKETQESLKRSKKFKRHIKEMEYLEGVETFLEKVKSWGRKL